MKNITQVDAASSGIYMTNDTAIAYLTTTSLILQFASPSFVSM